MAEREVVRFEVDQPQIVSLAYSSGKIVNGRHGDQWMWGLDGDRVMFLDPPVNDQLVALQPRTGESVSILKRSLAVGGRRRIEWDVQLLDDPTTGWPTDRPPATPSRSIATRPVSAPRSAMPAASNPAPRPVAVNADGETSLGMALSAAIVEAAKAEAFATSKGMSIRFSAEDIRTMANTILIGAQKQAGAR